MKLLILHSTFWPMIGGIESIMRQHAELFSAHGHEVRVVTGHGVASLESYSVENLKELSPGFPLNLQTKRAVDHGQTDKNLQDYTQLLLEVLAPHFDWADLVFTHGALTTHFNLALTQAVWKLAETKRVVAWTHDFTSTNKNYALPNPDHMPWALMKRPHPTALYVAVSSNRQKEICSTFKLSEDAVPVIENGIDFKDLLSIEDSFFEWLGRQDYPNRDIVFYYPTKMLQRKNIDQAIMYMDAIKKSGIKPLLLVSGSQDAYGTAGQSYEGYLKTFPAQLGLEKDVIYLNDHNDEIGQVWSQAFRISDVLLFPSAYEGHGLPPLEATLTKLPCWSSDLPTLAEWHKPALQIVKTPDDAVKAAQALMNDPAHTARKKIWRQHDWETLYQSKISPLITLLSA